MTFRVGEETNNPTRVREDLGPHTRNGMTSKQEAPAIQKEAITGNRIPGKNTKTHGTRIGTKDPKETQTGTEASPMKNIKGTEEGRR